MGRNALTTMVPTAYCVPQTTSTASNLFIKDVAFIGTLQDVYNYNNSFATSSPFGFQDFTALATKCLQAQGEGININVAGANSTSSNRGHWKVWVDWNKDGFL
jgi:meiotically up-regulated gene 157 (Mug157) protein